MSVAMGAVTSASINGAATTTTVSFTSTDQPLYVRQAFWRGSPTTTCTGITFNGVALTRVAQTAASNQSDIGEIWRLTAPGAATANVVVTFAAAASQAGTVNVSNTTGQSTSTPEGTAATAASTVNGSGTGTLTVAPAAGDLTIAVVTLSTNTQAITPAATGGSGLIEEWDAAGGGEGSEGFKVSDAATDVSASWGGTGYGWAIAAIPLKAGVSGPTTIATAQRLGGGYGSC